MRTILNIFLATLFMGSLLGFSAEAAADPITIEVRSIAASTTGSGFDGRLSGLKGKLTKAFAGYKSFEQVGTTTLSLDPQEAGAVRLPTGASMTLTNLGQSGRFIKLGMNIAGKLNTTLRATPGSTFFQAGLDYQDGILILAITVK